MDSLREKIEAEIAGFDAPEDEESEEYELWLDNLDSEVYGRYMALTGLLEDDGV